MSAPIFVPVDGRLTSLPQLTAVISGSIMEIVSPGNAANGVNYQVTVDVLGAYFSTFSYSSSTVITVGATVGSPYLIQSTDTRVLFNKITPSPSYAVVPLANSQVVPVPLLIKDIKGDANTNPITLTFAGGETCDGLSSMVIDQAFGWLYISPLPSGLGWYQSG